MAAIVASNDPSENFVNVCFHFLRLLLIEAEDVIVARAITIPVFTSCLPAASEFFNRRKATPSKPELGPGEIFGELASLETQPRSATVLTLEPTSCLKVSGTEFLAALRQSPTT